MLNAENIKPPIGVNRRCAGRFSIHFDSLLRDAIAAKALMSRIVVVKCDHNACTGMLEYWAYCDAFDFVDIGVEIPEYEPIFTTHDDKTVSVEFRKESDR